MILLVLVAGVGGWVVLSLLEHRPLDLRDRSKGAAAEVERILVDAGIPEEAVERSEEGLQLNTKAVWHAFRYKVRLPESVSAEELRRALAAKLASRSATVAEDREQSTLHLALSGWEFAQIQVENPAEPDATPEAPPKPVEIPAGPAPVVEMTTTAPAETALDPEPVGPAARIAVVFDDGGYGGDTTDAVLALDPRLTLAILPRTPKAAETARQAAELGFEVILHMPMEAEDGSSEVLNPLTVAMTPEEIVAATEQALAEVPGAVGVNNHEGSKFTGDSGRMKAFLQVLQGRSLYFLDSRTSPLSVAASTASYVGIPTAARDVFLDNENDEAQIRKQFDELLAVARKNGSAIGVCHFRAGTVRVLGELLTGLRERENVDLVHVSELVR